MPALIPPNTTGWILDNIVSKVRAITGMPNDAQMTAAQVETYVNNYLLYVMPHELKVQIANQDIMFKTQPGVNTYSFPAAFLTDSPGAYADGFPLIFYEDPDIFYQDWPLQYAVNTIGVGGGAVFAGTLQNPPVIEGSLFITDGTQVETDVGVISPAVFPNGSLKDEVAGVLGAVTGTIDYLTGVYSVTFPVATPATATVYAKYQSYAANRPQGVLFYQNQFVLMPVPDQAYQIQLQGFIAPTALTASTSPQQQEWGPLLAYGAALEIFSDRGDTDNYDKFYPMLKRYENVALGRTVQQYTPMQSVPRF
jgi:hypothetical protein